MDDVTEYLRKARGVTQSTFQQLYPHYFLYKHPKEARFDRPSEEDIDYATRAINLNFDPMPTVTQVVAVKKNPENPFPDRLTIGRATNCDVVIRFAFISKVHAHLFVQGDKLTLRDNKAANGTFHNHKKLDAASSRSIKLGDTLGFGALELELIDAARFYQLLRGASPLMSQGAPPSARRGGGSGVA
jgi:FHA domain-containing protein